jgi:hypothetical protein
VLLLLLVLLQLQDAVTRHTSVFAILMIAAVIWMFST